MWLRPDPRKSLLSPRTAMPISISLLCSVMSFESIFQTEQHKYYAKSSNGWISIKSFDARETICGGTCGNNFEIEFCKARGITWAKCWCCKLLSAAVSCAGVSRKLGSSADDSESRDESWSTIEVNVIAVTSPPTTNSPKSTYEPDGRESRRRWCETRMRCRVPGLQPLPSRVPRCQRRWETQELCCNQKKTRCKLAQLASLIILS